jgi:hypothetical protein
MTPGSTYKPATLQPPCLSREPRLGLRQAGAMVEGASLIHSQVTESPLRRGAEYVASHRIYYKGEGGGFPQGPGRGESCVSVLPMACPNTKGIQNEF